jgi:hypothetical protein
VFEKKRPINKGCEGVKRMSDFFCRESRPKVLERCADVQFGGAQNGGEKLLNSAREGFSYRRENAFIVSDFSQGSI